ncbi:hypothetical protein FRB96_000523 [Tulasnella sp. 330]|nr:hypothetical protein FRB96_000523 [Tulasnella sp. 330]
MVARSTVLSISLYLAVSSVAANSLVPAKRNIGSQVVSADSAPSSLARRDQEFAVQGRKTSNKWNKRSQSGQPSDSSDPDTASDSDSDSDSATNNVAKNRKRALVTRSLAKKRSLPSSLVRRNQSPPGGSGSDTGNDSDSSIGSDSDSDSDSPTAQNPQRSLATRSLRMKRFAPSSLARRSSQFGAPDQSSSNTGNTSSEETSSDSPSGDESQSSNDDSQSSGEGSSSGGESASTTGSTGASHGKRSLATRRLTKKRSALFSLARRDSQSGVPDQSSSNTGNISSEETLSDSPSGDESQSSNDDNQSSGDGSSSGGESASTTGSTGASHGKRSLATRRLTKKRSAPSSLARRSSQSGAPDQSSPNTGDISGEETSSNSSSGDENQSSNDDSRSGGEGSSSSGESAGTTGSAGASHGKRSLATRRLTKKRSTPSSLARRAQSPPPSSGSDTSGGSGNSSDSSSDSPTGQNTTRALATRSLMMKRFAPSSLVPRSSQSGVPVQSTSNTGNTSGEESPSSSEENQSSGEESPSDDENPQAPPLSTRSLKKRSPSPFFGRGSDGQGIGDPNGKVHYHHHHHHQLHHDHRRQHGTPYASGLQKRAWGSRARNQRMHAAQGEFDGHDAKHFHHRHEHGRLAESGGPSKWQQRTRSMYPNLESLD